MQRDVLERILHHRVSAPHAYVLLRNLSSTLTARAKATTRKLQQEKRAALQQRLGAKGKGLTDTYRLLRPPMNPPIQYLRSKDGST
eukprot:8359690-Alexandrium_andersonii.AAC.1